MENQAPSALQQQFPLSPKKFWKKILGSLVWCFFIVLVFFSLALLMQGAAIWGVSSVVMLIVLVYLLLRGWYIKAYIRRYFYSASEDFITIKKGVFAPAEIHVQYQKIQDVYVDQDILDRIMGLYDVHIASATVTSSIEAHIDGVEEAAADGLKLFLLNKIRGGGQSEAAQGSPTSSVQATPTTPTSLDASQMISSDQYPIGSRWMMMRVIGAFFHALWFSALITIYSAVNKFIAAGWGIGLVLGLVAFIFVFFSQCIYYGIWRNNFRFAFLPDYIKLSTRVIAKSEQHMPYRAIQDVVVRQGIADRIFGLATVSIQNAAANPLVSGASQTIYIPGQTLEGANKIADIIRSISLTKSSAKTGL